MRTASKLLFTGAALGVGAFALLNLPKPARTDELHQGAFPPREGSHIPRGSELTELLPQPLIKLFGPVNVWAPLCHADAISVVTLPEGIAVAEAAFDIGVNGEIILSLSTLVGSKTDKKLQELSELFVSDLESAGNFYETWRGQLELSLAVIDGQPDFMALTYDGTKYRRDMVTWLSAPPTSDSSAPLPHRINYLEDGSHIETFGVHAPNTRHLMLQIKNDKGDILAQFFGASNRIERVLVQDSSVTGRYPEYFSNVSPDLVSIGSIR